MSEIYGEVKVAQKQSELNQLLDCFEKELIELGIVSDRISSVSGSLAEWEPSNCEKEDEQRKAYPDGSLNRLRILIYRLGAGQRLLNKLADRLQTQV